MGAVKSGSTIRVSGVGNTLATITADINDTAWIEESPANTWTIKSKYLELMLGCRFTMGDSGDFSVAHILIFNNTGTNQCRVYIFNDAHWYVYGACKIYQVQNVTYYNHWYVTGKFHVEGDATYKPILENFYAPYYYSQYEIYEDDFKKFENMIWQNSRANGRFWYFAKARRLRNFGIEYVKDCILYGTGGTSTGIYGLGTAFGGDDTSKMLWENVVFDGFGTAITPAGKNVYLKNCQFINNTVRSATLIGAPGITPGEYHSENGKIARNFGQYGFSFFDGCTCSGGSAGEDIYLNENAWLLIRDVDFNNAGESVDVRTQGFLWIWTGNTHVSANPYGINGGRVFWVHGLDLTIKDKGGNPIEDATILVRQKDGKEFWSFRTDANGKPKTAGCLGGMILCIWREQTNTAGAMTNWSDVSNSTYHDIWIYAAGYEPATVRLVMSDERVQTVNLEDALTAPDVRDTIPFGLGLTGELDLPVIADVEKGVDYDSTTKTGTFKKPAVGDVRDGEGYGAGDVEFEGLLDLPAIGDVEKDVQFDNETKTGTFKVPPEANVEKDVLYGAAGTEFTGSLVRIVVWKSEAIGKLQQRVSMKGIFKEGG